MQVKNADAIAANQALLAVANLQDDLLMASHDLDRLQTLLADACNTLSEGFYGAAHELRAARETHAAAAAGLDFERVLHHLGTAMTALQFQDMASQLITHTHRRLRACADRMARDTFADDDGEAAVEETPLRPNPVTQSEMEAGSVELF